MTQRGKENDKDWKDYYEWLDKKLELGAYARNVKRQKVLIDYAAPYRLNIVTDNSAYKLSLDHPTTGFRAELSVTRELVDGRQNPEEIIKGYIDQLRREMERKYSGGQVVLESVVIAELERYALPFILEVRAETQSGRVSTAVELTIRNVPEYGFKVDTVMVPAGDKMETLRKCRFSIDKMRTELG